MVAQAEAPEQPYTEFPIDGQSIAGAAEMAPNIPAEMPSHWMVYFTVDDVDAAHRRVQDAGREMVAPLDFRVAGCRLSATRRARRSNMTLKEH